MGKNRKRKNGKGGKSTGRSQHEIMGFDVESQNQLVWGKESSSGSSRTTKRFRKKRTGRIQCRKDSRVAPVAHIHDTKEGLS